MYLLTFAFLMIAMLGLYTQLYAVQIARMFANQTGIADSVIIWHEAASSLAYNVMNTATTPLTVTGCSLTPTLAVPAFCILGGGSGSIPVTPNVMVTKAVNYTNPAGSVFPQLPGNYNTGAYQWNSIAYQPTPSSYYVITFVPPPVISATNPAPGFISTASAAPQQLSITMSDLMHQLKIAGLPLYAYGYVSGGVLVTGAALPVGPPTNGAPITYPVPPAVPANSVAIISSPGHCSAC